MTDTSPDPDGFPRRLPMATIPAMGLPRREAAMPKPAAAEPSDDRIFDKLVTDEKDLAGLVAYSLHTLARHDWAEHFQATRGREPNSEDVKAYQIGEETPKRLESYRRLAESLIQERLSAGLAAASAGQTAAANTMPAQTSLAAALANQPKPKLKQMLIQLGLLGLAVVVVGLMIRFLLVRP